MNNINNCFNNPVDGWRLLFNSDQSDDSAESNSGCHRSEPQKNSVDKSANTSVDFSDKSKTLKTNKPNSRPQFEESSRYSSENEESNSKEKSTSNNSTGKTSPIWAIFNKVTSFLHPNAVEGEEYDPISGTAYALTKSEKNHSGNREGDKSDNFQMAESNDYIGSWDDQVKPNVQFPSNEDVSRYKDQIKKFSTDLLPFAIIFGLGTLEAKRKSKNIDSLIASIPVLRKLGEGSRLLYNNPVFKLLPDLLKSTKKVVCKVLGGDKSIDSMSNEIGKVTDKAPINQICVNVPKEFESYFLTQKQIPVSSLFIKLKVVKREIPQAHYETMLKQVVELVKEVKQTQTISIGKQFDYVINIPLNLRSRVPTQEKITVKDLLKEIGENGLEVNLKELTKILYHTKGVSKRGIKIILKTVSETSELFTMKLTRKTVNMSWFATNALIGGLCQTFIGMSNLKYDQVVQWKNDAINQISSHLSSESYKLHHESKDFVSLMISHLKDLEQYPNDTERQLLERVINEAIESYNREKHSIDEEIDQWGLSLNNFIQKPKSKEEITSVEFLKNFGVFALGPFTKNLISVKLPLEKMQKVRMHGAELVSNTGVSLSTNATKELISEGANRRDVQLLLKELKLLAKSDVTVMKDVKILNVALNTIFDVPSKVVAKVWSNQTVKSVIAFKFKSFFKIEYSKNDESKIKDEEAKALFDHTANEMIDIISRLSKNHYKRIQSQKSTLEEMSSVYKARQSAKQK